MEEEWIKQKECAWARLWEDLEIGYLDTDIVEVLLEIFARPKSFPKSSCSGRIAILDTEYPWTKKETMIVYKKHKPTRLEEIIEVLKRPFSSRLWLSLQGPIYHVYVADLEEAGRILSIAHRAGFKHSGIMVMKNYPMLELRTGIRLDVLVADREKIFLSKSELGIIVNIVNKGLVEAKNRNNRLLKELRLNRPKILWEKAREAIEMYKSNRVYPEYFLEESKRICP